MPLISRAKGMDADLRRQDGWSQQRVGINAGQYKSLFEGAFRV
jgi:hypothetical protein